MFPRNLSSVAANTQLGLGESDPRNVMQKSERVFKAVYLIIYGVRVLWSWSMVERSVKRMHIVELKQEQKLPQS